MIKKIALFGAGNAGTAVLNLLATIYFSKNLNENDFSNFILYQTLINLLFCVIGYNLGAGVLKKTIDDFELTRYVGSVVIVNVLISTFLVILVTAFGEEGIKYLVDVNFDWYRLIIFSMIFSLFQLSFIILQSKGEAKKYFFIRNTYALVFFLMIIFFGQEFIKNWNLFFDAQALLMGIVSSMVIFYFTREFQIKDIIRIKNEFLYCIKFGAKLMPYTISGWVIGNLDKILLNKNQNKAEQIAVLAVGQSIYSIAAFLFVAINAAWAPQFLKIMTKDDVFELRKYKRRFFILIVSAVIIVFIGAIFIEYTYTKKGYNNYLLVLVVLGLTKFLDGDSIFYSNYFYFNEDVEKLSKIALIGSSLYILFLYFGGMYFGLVGVLLAGLIHSFVINISYRSYVRKRRNE